MTTIEHTDTSTATDLAWTSQHAGQTVVDLNTRAANKSVVGDSV